MIVPATMGEKTCAEDGKVDVRGGAGFPPEDASADRDGKGIYLCTCPGISLGSGSGFM